MERRIKYLQEEIERKESLIEVVPVHERPQLLEDLADLEVSLRLFEVTQIVSEGNLACV